MLSKRVNILFDENTWNKLIKIARDKQSSVGKLVRVAVVERYLDEAKKTTRERAIESTLKNRSVSKAKIDYKQLIDHGRKH